MPLFFGHKIDVHDLIGKKFEFKVIKIMSRFYLSKFLFLLILATVLFSVSKAQSTKTPRKKTVAKAVKNEKPAPETIAELPVDTTKKNARPEEPQTNEPQKKNRPDSKTATASKDSFNPVYFYEFSVQQFIVNHIVIEHDENGKGRMTFEKQSLNEPISDPIQISPKTMEKIKNLYEALHFLDSNEDYQSKAHQFPHLGTMKLRWKNDGKERTAEFNWSENKDAQNLVNEYKKISEQFIWIFEINLARENQPLNAPELIDRLDASIKNDWLSDTEQLIPFLQKLAEDERIPLLARNHATKIIKQIEKKK